MSTPMDRLLDAVKWREMPQPSPAFSGDPDALYATHEGDLEIGPLKLRCYVLNDGQRVFDATDVEAAFAPEGKQPLQEGDRA